MIIIITSYTQNIVFHIPVTLRIYSPKNYYKVQQKRWCRRENSELSKALHTNAEIICERLKCRL